MFTILVMLITIFTFWYGGVKIFKRAKTTQYRPAYWLAITFLTSGFGIFCYLIRSILVQFDFFTADQIIYRIGGFVHMIGFIPVIYFTYKEFAPKLIRWTIGLLSGLGMVFIGISTFFPLKTILVKQAPLEIIPFKMTSFPWEWMFVNKAFMLITVVVPILLFLVFLINGLKARNKKVLLKSLMYGFGILMIIIPTPACVFISPIFARLGYVAGAILAYKAFRMKLE